MKVRPDLCEKQGIEIVDKPEPELNQNILVLGVGCDCGKKLEAVKMHCTKNGIENITFNCVQDKIDAKDYDGVFLIVCGEHEDFELDSNALKLTCGYLSDTQKVTEDRKSVV